MTENVELHITFSADGDKTNFEFSVVHETEDYAKAQEKMGFLQWLGFYFNKVRRSCKQTVKQVIQFQKLSI